MNEIVITVSGGVVQDVYSNVPVAVKVIDYDAQESEGIPVKDTENEVIKAIREKQSVY